jgi:hypothetical protein
MMKYPGLECLIEERFYYEIYRTSFDRHFTKILISVVSQYEVSRHSVPTFIGMFGICLRLYLADAEQEHFSMTGNLGTEIVL